MRRIPLPFVFVFAALACGDPPAAPSRRPPAKLSFGMDEPPRPPPFPPLAADPPATKAVPVAASTPAPVATPAPTVPPAPAPLPVLKAKKASEATMMIVVEAPKELVEALNTLATDTKAPPWIKTAKEQISLQASSGSGFALTVESAAGSWVATNAHVTEGGWTHIARMPDRPQPFSLEAAFVDRNNDIAILKSVERIPGLPLAEKNPENGLAVYTAGFPGINGMTGYNETQGTITNTCSGRSCFLLHSAPVAHGNSGGPLMDATSQAVVGINTAIHRRAKNTYIATRANYVVAAVRQAQEAQAALAAKKAPPGLGEACKDLIVTIAKARLGQDLDMGEEIVRIHPRLMAKSLQALSTETKLNTQVPKLKKDAYAATTMIALVQIISRGLPPGAIPSPESCREIPAPSFTDASEPTAAIDIPDTEHRVSKATFKWSHGAWRLWDFSR